MEVLWDFPARSDNEPGRQVSSLFSMTAKMEGTAAEDLCRAARDKDRDSDLIAKTAGVRGGDSYIKHSGIRVWELEERRHLGWSDNQILNTYWLLRPEHLAAAWTYVAQHRDEIEEALRDRSGLVRLSPATQQRLDLLFRPADRAEAAKLLVEQCGNNLPSSQDDDEYALERIRFAALKRSDGDLGELRDAIWLAKSDWRDLLVDVGFANDVRAHERWLPGNRGNESME